MLRVYRSAVRAVLVELIKQRIQKGNKR